MKLSQKTFPQKKIQTENFPIPFYEKGQEKLREKFELSWLVEITCKTKEKNEREK